MSIAIGEQAPGFELPDTEGGSHELASDAPATVVVFTCNHCPYALAWQERLRDAALDLQPRGARFLLINPNDAERYPRDSLEAMAERVREEGDWPFPYLRDETQEVARAYDAKTTPDVFVLDGELRLRYRGAPDEDHREPTLRAQWLRDAVERVLAGEEPDPAQTEPVGCSIKWRADG